MGDPDQAMAELLGVLRSNTAAVKELRDEVKRLSDNFAKVITSPPQHVESGSTVDLGHVAGKATVAALNSLFGGKKKR